MSKLLLIFIISLLPSFCYAEYFVNAIEILEEKLVFVEEYIDNYTPQSGLDIQQYYFLLGQREAYKEAIEIILHVKEHNQ